MFVLGVDGCRAEPGWVAFKVDVVSRATSVEIIDLTSRLRTRPPDWACLAIDIPIGLLNSSRDCDRAARKLLGQPRGSSVFAAPCRAALEVDGHPAMSAVNKTKTGRGLSLQAYGIAPKIKQVDDAITPESQQWAFEVHPEVCFWALAEKSPMKYSKKTKAGSLERLNLLCKEFPNIDRHLKDDRPPGVAKDDLLDACVAAWTALRRYSGDAISVCEKLEHDERGLEVSIWY